MNIPKYLLPASIAAMVHVALFNLAPEPIVIEGDAAPEKTVLLPIPTRPIEQPAEKPKPEDFEKEVRPLAGGPTPPVSPEIVRPLTKEDIAIPADERPTYEAKDLKIVPKTFGPGDVEGIGDLDMPDIFKVGDLERVPRAKVQVPPEYPHAMKQTGAGGSVVVEFDVDTSGHVVRAEARSYSDREFAEPAVRAVRKWRFEPGRRDGKAVPFRMTIPIEFSIENDK
jgi:periplasmic protein TonB